MLNPSFSGRGRTFLPWREKGKVKTFVDVKFFYIVDQLLMRSLWLESFQINDFINSDFHIFLLIQEMLSYLKSHAENSFGKARHDLPMGLLPHKCLFLVHFKGFKFLGMPTSESCVYFEISLQ